ncbi:hypothetical protein ACQEVF_57585 [Nonomuraea polychroma]|uniref:hypothetical protein n=1 Tax=Nonomuraea polychroma TaxID=46176 RepID=UPI003D8CEA92
MSETKRGTTETPTDLSSVTLTRGQVAELWRVDPATVDRWRNTGKVAARVKPGGSMYEYPAEQFKKVIELLNWQPSTARGRAAT